MFVGLVALPEPHRLGEAHVALVLDSAARPAILASRQAREHGLSRRGHLPRVGVPEDVLMSCATTRLDPQVGAHPSCVALQPLVHR